MSFSRLGRLMAILGLAVLLGVLGPFSTQAQNDAPSSAAQDAAKSTARRTSTRAETILVSRCFIKLVDTAVLASDRPGILEFVEPQEGETVRAGQQVAGLKDGVARAAFAIAEEEATNRANILYAEKFAEVAEAEYEKAIAANKQNPGTYTEIDLRHLKLSAEKGRLQQLQAESQFAVAALKRDEAEEILKTYRVEAPFDGVVTNVLKHKGEAVQQGQPILEIVSTSRVRVEGNVHLKDVGKFAPGTYVKIQVDIPDADVDVENEIFEGRISFVDVKADPVQHEVRIAADVINVDGKLKEGMSARMAIFPGRQVSARRFGEVRSAAEARGTYR